MSKSIKDGRMSSFKINPSIELIERWHEEAAHRQYSISETENHLIEMAAQWGYQQAVEELENYLEKQRDI